MMTDEQLSNSIHWTYRRPTMTLVAFFHHHKQYLPIVMEVSSTEKFRELCDTFPTDWAYLMNKETGEILYTFRSIV